MRRWTIMGSGNLEDVVYYRRVAERWWWKHRVSQPLGQCRDLMAADVCAWWGLNTSTSITISTRRTGRKGKRRPLDSNLSNVQCEIQSVSLEKVLESLWSAIRYSVSLCVKLISTVNTDSSNVIPLYPNFTYIKSLLVCINDTRSDLSSTCFISSVHLRPVFNPNYLMRKFLNKIPLGDFI